MDQNLLHATYLALAYGALFGAAEWLYHVRKLAAEFTRKVVHSITGLLTLLFPILLDSHWWVLTLCGSFAALLLLTQKKGWLPSIHAIDRISRGSILYPAIVYGCFWVFEQSDEVFHFYLPILIMALCDPLAALVGKRWPLGRYQLFQSPKTIAGSVAFWATAFALSWALLQSSTASGVIPHSLLALFLATVTTLAEGVSGRGYDNFTIPTVALLVLWLFGF